MKTTLPVSIYSTEEKVTERYCFLWEIIRRHPDYLKFCLKHRHNFDRDKMSFLDETRLSSKEKKECEKIKKRFRLSQIVAPKSSIPKKTMKAFSFFCDEHSVVPELKDQGDGTKTPIWERRFVRLRIDIRGFRTKKEIIEETWNCIKWARKVGKIEPLDQSLPDDKTFRVWDMKKEGRRNEEIIQEIWAEDYHKEFSSLNDSQKDRCFKESFWKYQKKEGNKDFDGRAYERFYRGTCKSENGESIGGKIKLFMRVTDNMKKMERAFKEFFPVPVIESSDPSDPKEEFFQMGRFEDFIQAPEATDEDGNTIFVSQEEYLRFKAETRRQKEKGLEKARKALTIPGQEE